MASIQLDCAAGWTEVDPNPDGPKLLVEHAGRLRYMGSDGRWLHDFGPVGPVDCPLAYDASTRTAYRYVCGSKLSLPDFSQLRAYSIDSASSRAVCQLPLNQWVLWMLEWLGEEDGKGQLFGLLSSDLPVEGQVCIQHRLFALDPSTMKAAQPRVRSLCSDAYKPLAFSVRRKELVFSGASGTYLVGLKGERLTTLEPDLVSPADGAAFHPGGDSQVVLGGEGLHLWDLRTGESRHLNKLGRHPVWARDGKGFWFAGSSGALLFYDLESETVEPVLAIRQNRCPDFWKSRPVRVSLCGNYLAAMLSAKRLKGITRKTGGIEKSEKVYQAQDCFCILHLPSQTFWRIEGAFFSAFQWL